MESFINKYNRQINFTLSCYDRIVITGTLPEISYAQGMTNYLYSKGIRILDYAQFVEGHRDAIRKPIDSIVSASGLEVQYLNPFFPPWRVVTLTSHGMTSQGEAHS